MVNVKSRSNELSRETYGFDAIRGVQAEREYYVAICPLKIIPKLFIFNDYEIPANLRAQRTLREKRIPDIKNYILNNPKEYIFSSLAASVDGTMKFVPSAHLGPEGKLGRLYINMDSRLLINDGQHRRKAIEEALKERPELGHESISVVFLEDAGLKRSQQMFADLNKNSQKPPKSLNIVYDHRDQFSQFIVSMAMNMEMFNDRVELEKTTLSNRSSKFFTMNGIYDATKKLLGKTKIKRITKDQGDMVKEFWETLAANIPEWQLLIQGKVAPAELRQNFVHANTNCLNAFGVVGRVLIETYPDRWKDKMKLLRNIDWSRSNKQWEGRLLQSGRMMRTVYGIELAANTILEQCKVKLTPERMEFEKK